MRDKAWHCSASPQTTRPFTVPKRVRSSSHDKPSSLQEEASALAVLEINNRDLRVGIDAVSDMQHECSSIVENAQVEHAAGCHATCPLSLTMSAQALNAARTCAWLHNYGIPIPNDVIISLWTWLLSINATRALCMPVCCTLTWNVQAQPSR